MLITISTQQIARGLGRNHDHVRHLIEKYRKDFEEISQLKRSELPSTGGRRGCEYLLTHKQIILLFTLLRNTQSTVALTQKLITTGSLVEAMGLLQEFDFGESKQRFVYAAQDKYGHIKIGISNDPARRLKELNIGNASTLQLVMTREAKGDGYSDEIALHKLCENHWIRSEWFAPPAIDLIKELAQ